jgi:hypothetical protein
MSETNKTYRINTSIGGDVNYISIDASLVQDYESFDILSVNIKTVDAYKLHNSNYGAVVGRVLANNGFGVPNAKISIFIPSDGEDNPLVSELYPFTSLYSRNNDGVRYNLLPDNEVKKCHSVVGTFPNKRFMLDNETYIEVFDKYYKFTTRTNNGGDYMIMGVPVGTYTLHMDLDLSDCGILSQKPRDFVYKGYTIEQFENPNKFKDGTSYDELSQIFSQDQVVTIQPLWGNESIGETIGLTRADINISFKFEPTCVFLGCVVSDNSSQGITKRCIPTEKMGFMEELVTGEGTIEMIRYTPSGDIEELEIRGTQLINGDGVWCYQIPMNLDYMMTDEYGNMVPTDDPNKGIPTRSKVRFRVSMADNEENVDNFFRAKVLVPHNPKLLSSTEYEEYDYEFGSKTKESSFRDLFWNNVYTVKSYIPRFQKRKVSGWKETKFTGIKSCNFFGTNNPIPYNNIRIKLPLMFTIMCVIIKSFIMITRIFNTVISSVGWALAKIGNVGILKDSFQNKVYNKALSMHLNILDEGLCPDLENWFFAPIITEPSKLDESPRGLAHYNIMEQTLNYIGDGNETFDQQSIDETNKDENGTVCITTKTDFLISCIELNLAMEYKVINFDFYNDWINGMLYFPRFMRYVKPKKTFRGKKTIIKAKVKGCMDDIYKFSKTMRYTQQCALGHYPVKEDDKELITGVKKFSLKPANNKLHKYNGFKQKVILGKNGGVCHEHTTSKQQHVYYMKPCEWGDSEDIGNIKVNLFATDLVLLGSLNDCDFNGVPAAYKFLSSTSYVMPTNLALTNMETNGPLYSTEKGVYCSGNEEYKPKTTSSDRGVGVVEQSLSNELKYYKDSGDDTLDVTYDGNELSDVIAVTEVAGVSWNYTGPGQGKIDEDKMYYPGGHFLGLSCVNSQTNIKSCINLSRICEVGVNMSQRREDIYTLENGIPKYKYKIPSGFISGDDIIAPEFRSMFATMNHKPLRATKLDPVTGYKVYDFDFIHPTGFDGRFKGISNNSLYNGAVKPPVEDYGLLSKLGIDTSKLTRPDYDPNEYENTIVRTIEDASVDYYIFKMGLSHSDLKTDDNFKKHRFLLKKDGEYFLPQYENSYYFYFGLKNGASAIEEFNKQFFSVCETNKNISVEGSLSLTYDEVAIESGIVKGVKLHAMDIEMPYIEVSYTNENNKIVNLTSGETNGRSNIVTYTIDIGDIPIGSYSFKVIDTKEKEYTFQKDFKSDLFSVDFNVYDFNVTNPKDTKLINEVLGVDDYQRGSDSDLDKIVGGYVRINNVKIKGITSSCTYYMLFYPHNDSGTTSTNYEVRVSGNTVPYFNISSSIIPSFSGNSTTLINNINDFVVGDFTEKEDTIAYLSSSNTSYDIYLAFSKNEDSQKIYIDTIKINDTSSVDICMGYNEVVRDNFANNDVKLYLSMVEDANSENPYGDYSLVNAMSNNNWVTDEDKNNSEDSEVNRLKWICRLCAIKSNSSGEVFSNKVYAVNGTKVLWGVPQNSEESMIDYSVLTVKTKAEFDKYKEDPTKIPSDIKEKDTLLGVKNNEHVEFYKYINGDFVRILFNSKDDYNLYEGYTLNDDYNYHETGLIDYSALAYNGNTVAGNFAAYRKNGGEIKIINSGYFGTNRGFVLKPIEPYGDLQFHTGIITSDMKFKEGETDIESFVIYPSISYPVIQKQFSINGRFYLWEDKHIGYSNDMNGKPVAKNLPVEYGSRTELEITNGITYANKFSNNSKISNINTISGITVRYSDASYKDNTITIVGNTPLITDGENENYGNIVDKDNKIVGYSGITELFANIIYGHPDIFKEKENLLESRDIGISIENLFPKSLQYSRIGERIFKINEKSENNVSIGLYLHSGSSFFEKTQPENRDDKDFYFLKEENNSLPVYHVLCEFLNIDSLKEYINNNAYIISQNGDNFVLKINFIEKGEFNKFNIEIPIMVKEDYITYETKILFKNSSDSTVFNISSGISINLINIFSAITGEVETVFRPLCRVYMKATEPIMDTKNWIDMLNGQNYFKPLGGGYYKSLVNEVDSESNIAFGLAKYVETDEFNNTTATICKIYPVLTYTNGNMAYLITLSYGAIDKWVYPKVDEKKLVIYSYRNVPLEPNRNDSDMVEAVDNTIPGTGIIIPTKPNYKIPINFKISNENGKSKVIEEILCIVIENSSLNRYSGSIATDPMACELGTYFNFNLYFENFKVHMNLLTNSLLGDFDIVLSGITETENNINKTQGKTDIFDIFGDDNENIPLIIEREGLYDMETKNITLSLETSAHTVNNIGNGIVSNFNYFTNRIKIDGDITSDYIEYLKGQNVKFIISFNGIKPGLFNINNVVLDGNRVVVPAENFLAGSAYTITYSLSKEKIEESTVGGFDYQGFIGVSCNYNDGSLNPFVNINYDAMAMTVNFKKQ